MANVIELRFEATEAGDVRISQLSSTIGKELDKTEQVARTAGGRISDAFKGVGGAIGGIGKRIMSLQGLIGAFVASRAVGRLTNFVGAIGRDIEKMKGFGRKAIDLFTGGIREGHGELEDTAAETTQILDDYMNQMSPAQERGAG